MFPAALSLFILLGICTHYTCHFLQMIIDFPPSLFPIYIP